jgi:hypothetical protein
MKYHAYHLVASHKYESWCGALLTQNLMIFLGKINFRDQKIEFSILGGVLFQAISA